MTEGAIAYYQATGKNKLLNAAKRFADYISGFFGDGEGRCKGYPGHEIAEMALVRLYEVTGEKKYLELSYFFVNERGKRPYYFDQEKDSWKIEKGHEEELRYFYYQAHFLYNTVLSGMALDGKSFFYVNPLEVVPEACYLDERKFHVKPVRQKWFGCACCPPNLARLVSSIGSYAYTEKKEVLYIHLYMDSKVYKELHGDIIEIFVITDYPWDGKIRVEVKGATGLFTVALRISGWCRDYQVKGIEDADTWMEEGYLYIKKKWTNGDFVELDFPMKVRVLEADSRVREDVGKVAVMRGPFVYCLEEADNGKDLHLISIDVDSKAKVAEQEIAKNVIKAVSFEGFRQKPVQAEGKGLYYTAGKIQKKRVTLHFVPYYVWANRGENEMQVWVRR